MHAYERSLVAGFYGKVARKKHFLQRSLKLEMQAVNQALENNQVENAALLQKSAASLAYQCNDLVLARKLASAALINSQEHVSYEIKKLLNYIDYAEGKLSWLGKLQYRLFKWSE